MVAALTKPSASAPAMAANKVAPPAAPPTAKPPAVAAAASAPAAAASAPQRAAADEARQVNAAVQAWATAWSRKDLNAYFAAYAPGFKGTSGSAAAWQTARRDRIVGKSAIHVELSGVTVEMGQGVARVSFSQSYAADQLRVTSQKTLELVKQGDRWVIRKESVG
jgi:ketosteroid isomerase-like protein